MAVGAPRVNHSVTLKACGLEIISHIYASLVAPLYESLTVNLVEQMITTFRVHEPF